MPQTIAIIQARMGSNRLPGKILLKLKGKTIIEHLLTVVQQCKNISTIYLASSLDEKNKPLAEIAARHKINIFFGSEDDVLDRFWQVVEKEKAAGKNYDHLVRICADSPFLDAEEIDTLITAHDQSKADLSINYNHATGLPCGFGVEVISMPAFTESHRLAETAEHHEHLDEWILQHPERYKILKHSVPQQKQSYRLHFTVDYPEDFTFLEKAIENITPLGSYLDPTTILETVRKNPQLLQHRRMNLFVRADGNGEIGMGHLMRSMTVCQALKEVIPSLQVTFFTNPESVDFVKKAGDGYSAIIYTDQVMQKALLDVNPDLVLIDLRKHLDDASSLPLSRALRVRFIDSEIPREVRGDLVINSFPLSQFNSQSNQYNAAQSYYAGLNYLPLRKEFSSAPEKNVSTIPKEVLVMLGGGNLHIEQLKIMTEVAADFPKLHFTLITGAAMDQANQLSLQAEAKKSTNITVLQNVSNIHEYMQKADLGISGGGNTLFEFARCGVPVISISTDYDSTHSSHQQHYCKAFEKAGTSIYLGHNTAWQTETLQQHLKSLLENLEMRKGMSEKGQQLIDGQATEKIKEMVLHEYVKG